MSRYQTPQALRRALEARLNDSPDLKRALEDLRAVSKAVKDLPKQPLPAGFIARLRLAQGVEKEIGHL